MREQALQAALQVQPVAADKLGEVGSLGSRAPTFQQLGGGIPSRIPNSKAGLLGKSPPMQKPR